MKSKLKCPICSAKLTQDIGGNFTCSVKLMVNGKKTSHFRLFADKSKCANVGGVFIWWYPKVHNGMCNELTIYDAVEEEFDIAIEKHKKLAAFR